MPGKGDNMRFYFFSKVRKFFKKGCLQQEYMFLQQQVERGWYKAAEFCGVHHHFFLTKIATGP